MHGEQRIPRPLGPAASTGGVRAAWTREADSRLPRDASPGCSLDDSSPALCPPGPQRARGSQEPPLAPPASPPSSRGDPGFTQAAAPLLIANPLGESHVTSPPPVSLIRALPPLPAPIHLAGCQEVNLAQAQFRLDLVSLGTSAVPAAPVQTSHSSERPTPPASCGASPSPLCSAPGVP